MVNELDHLEAFRDILKEYRISSAGKRILARTRLALLVGPTSAGRNTIINELIKSGKYHAIISDTTRRPRVNNGIPEQNGREYWFRDEKDVLADLRAGRFLEAAVIHDQQVSGISLRELERAQQDDKVAITEIEIVGMHNIHQLKPDAFAFFVAPPSFTVWMERMSRRGKMPEVEKIRRLKSAVKEFEAALTSDFYTYIVNDNFEHSVERIHRYVLEGEPDPQQQALDRAIIEKLLIDTQAYLREQ